MREKDHRWYGEWFSRRVFQERNKHTARKLLHNFVGRTPQDLCLEGTKMQLHMQTSMEATGENWSLMLQAFATDPRDGDPSSLLVAARQVKIRMGEPQELLEFMLPHLDSLMNASVQVFSPTRFRVERFCGDLGIRLASYCLPGSVRRTLNLRLKSSVWSRVRELAEAVAPLLGKTDWCPEIHDCGVEIPGSDHTLEGALEALRHRESCSI